MARSARSLLLPGGPARTFEKDRRRFSPRLACDPPTSRFTQSHLAGPGMIELRLLSSLSLTDPGREELPAILRQPKRLALLAYLAVATPRLRLVGWRASVHHGINHPVRRRLDEPEDRLWLSPSSTARACRVAPG